MRISPARIASFEILRKIEIEKAFSSVLLPIYEKNLQENDRSLCHELTLGTLRQQIYIDKIIEKFVTKKLDIEVKIALRLGIYQIYFLDRIPLYSIINESVNLVQRAKKTSAKGLVNAILRKIGNASDNVKDIENLNEVEKISIETSHPKWLVEHWISQFGFEEAEKICRANNETPSLDYRWTAKTTEETRRHSDGEMRKKSFELAEKGEIYFQDKASQMVAEVIDLKEGDKFLDVCCSPASKLSQIAINQKSQIKNQKLLGGDIHFHRLQISKESCQRQGIDNVELIQYDGEKSLPFADESFDVILVDAPCSGTGTIRHNPEIRYHLNEKDLVELPVKQLKILENASKLLKKNGSLIYSTCSLEIVENEKVIESFLTENIDFQIIKPKLHFKFITKENFARTFPHKDRIDGFFIAQLMRKN
jgi:16S rRNA (cytosine967-C5)-methyltransferase